MQLVNIDYCIVVTDNGSTDKTLDLCEEEGVFINHVKEKGYGSNLKNAIEKIQSKYIIFFDCDGSYDPKEIKKFVKVVKDDDTVDMVYGNRLKLQEKNSMPWLHRYLGTPVLSFLIRILFSLKIYDCNSVMRLLKKNSFINIPFFCKGM